MLESLHNKYLMALGRTLLVLIYFIGGFALLTGDVPVDYAASKGLPAFAVWIGFAIKLFAGLAVIIGFQTRIAALLLVLFTLGTAFIFHPFWVEGEWNSFWKEISMIGGLLFLAAVGPGALSVDERKK
ncbi:putative oxidoreductase [Halopseudomonas xinjiangensis]|uniref:Putative oxidoreductase n=1 Tax=Halopseudomonas xinjiangensis TaxID=487184 RepID=A0A1H1T0G5_9GAMM|nr:DoxX family protein [Halopseudomonas xinjiangensis]SDS53661.1 putative oxidoreductase [Halopseudomonas xinjiangensis]